MVMSREQTAGLSHTMKVDNTGQQRFWPMRKISVSDVFLDAEFEYVSRISLSPSPFVLHQTL